MPKPKNKKQWVTPYAGPFKKEEAINLARDLKAARWDGQPMWEGVRAAHRVGKEWDVVVLM